jgi:hypothetical protein
VNFNSEIADEWARTVSRRALLLRGRHAPRRCSGLKPLSGQRAARPAAASPAPLPTAPRTPRRANRRLTPLARPTAASRAMPLSRQLAPRPRRSEATSPEPRPPSPIARRHLRAGEPPSPPSPVRRRCVVAGSPSSAAAPCAARRARRPSRLWAAWPWAVPALRTRCARGPSQRRRRGPRPALCVWAESDFGLVHPVKFY